MAKGFKTGGRTKGTPNKRTVELQQKAEQAAASIAQALGSDVFDGDAHAFLMSVYRDKTQPVDLRLDAAKAAAPFEKPRLSSNDTKLSGGLGIRRDPASFTDDELAAIAAGSSNGTISPEESAGKLSRVH